jgi:serine/threonine protein kinase
MPSEGITPNDLEEVDFRTIFSKGDVFGQYEVIRLLGIGGMGQVYEMRHKVLNTRHAIKLINPVVLEFEGALNLFKKEARVMALLDHKGIVRVDEFGETENHAWLRQELMHGIESGDGKKLLTLKDYISNSGGFLEQEEVWECMRQFLDALNFAHTKGCVHRDLKPANVLLNPDGMKIADFGLVHLTKKNWHIDTMKTLRETKGISASLTTSENAVVGTYEYMSPEQKEGRADERCDLYAVGLICFQMLTGRKQPGMKKVSLVKSGISKFWDSWLEKALEENIESRFQTAGKMLDALIKLPIDPKAEDKSRTMTTNFNQETPDSQQRKNPYTKILPNFFADLANWFWEHGAKRETRYNLPLDEWGKRLYDRTKEVKNIQGAKEQAKPATAIWGPSQTGKSTLISNFLDANAELTGTEGTDGSGSALHWPGGTPFFFFDPRGGKIKDESLPKDHLDACVLNPFNVRMDASACLSRFVEGSLTEEPGKYHVRNPMYPVEILLVKKKDLMHALARGYITECLDNSHTGDSFRWNFSSFQNKIEEYKIHHATEGGPPSREIYEEMHDFCEILNDLARANIDRYKDLRDEGDDHWDSLRNSLLSEAILVGNKKVMRKFISEVLWDSSEIIETYHKRISEYLQKREKQWTDKGLFCSLQVAAQLLNMATPLFYFEPDSGNVSAHSLETIRNIGYKEEDGAILIGSGSDFPNRFTETADQYAIFQGLVWELIIPLNLSNLNDSSFAEFMAVSDLLDFPGVGNESANEATKISLDSQKAGQNTAVEFEPKWLYYRILKRGKTASIVSTYAKRLSIDCFNIFIALDQPPPVNAGQLKTGIEVWWSSFDPEFLSNPSEGSPLPLNLGLCWWAPRLNEVTSTMKGVYKNLEGNHKALGKVGDPEICTTFALNYHKIEARGGFSVNWEPGSERYNNLREDPAFQRQFHKQVSLDSVDEMLTDKETGGAGFFFSQLVKQIEENGSGTESTKQIILADRLKSIWNSVDEEFFNDYSIWPEEIIPDIRKESLGEFATGISESLMGMEEPEVQKLSHALRQLLNISPSSLGPLPSTQREITLEFVSKQYSRWIRSQIDQFKEKGKSLGWDTLGIHSSEKLKVYLEALIESAEAFIEKEDVIPWIHELVSRSSQQGLDGRQFLALKLTNLIVHGPQNHGNEASSNPEIFQAEHENELEVNPKGKSTIAYTSFIKPFLEDQIRYLIKMKTETKSRPTQEGDAQLKALYKRHFS